MQLGTSARCTSAIIVNESMTVDDVGGEVVAVRVGVCVSVKKTGLLLVCDPSPSAASRGR